MEAPYKIRRPAGLEDYILRVVADRTYLLIDKRAGTALCTRCGKETKSTEVEYLYHKTEYTCPCCGERAIAIEKRYGRKNITEFGRILWFQKHGRVTFAQLDEYSIDYTGDRPKVHLWPSAQYRLSKEMQEYHKHIPEGYWHGDYWEQRKNIRLPEAVAGLWNYYKVPKYQKTVTHTSVIGGTGTDLKYANKDMTRLEYKDPLDPYGMIRYMHYFLKYQSIELLEKAGFHKVVAARLRSGCREINWRATDLRKILKLNSRELREFRDAGGETWMLERYKHIQKMGYHLDFDKVKHLTGYNVEEHIKSIVRFVPIEKALDYIDARENAHLYDYKDYLEECNKLGYDMKKKKILFPENLQEAHKKTSAAVEIAKDHIRQKEFELGMQKIYDKPEFTDGNLLIRPAKSIGELCGESKALHHCVRTYADRVCDGKCAILFIRKASDPDLPYYTLELSPEGKIVQCRGDHNCSMTDEVKAFVEHWYETVAMKKKKGKAA